MKRKLKHGWIIGLDIGGTFTDVVMVDPAVHRLERFKCLTTPNDPAQGAMSGIRGILAQVAAHSEDVTVVLHATTLVSNALIERKGAPTALVSTGGFRDVLRIGREKKYDIYDLQIEKPEPLVADHLCLEIIERIAADGSVVEPINESSVERAAVAIQLAGVKSVAVCLLHSYMNPAHERQVRELLKKSLGDVSVSLSSDVLPELREFERASTTSANAFVQPITDSYLRRFVEGLSRAGLHASLFIMLSEGGIAAPDIVRKFPIRICESGPAAGAITAASIAKQKKLRRVLSFDMGGTTAKTALIHDGAPEITTDFEVARMYRFKKGSGLPLRVPVIDLIEIGAGGGSIVRIDGLGLVKVGPDSVGADPGPACYGNGGTLPTVTDADLLLGYLDAGSFLGGCMQLDVQAARTAVETHVANPLGISINEAALGIHAIVNENMANASRMQAVERGFDPSGYAMVAFGGAGPVHAWGVAERLRIGTLVIPPTAGLGSALGLLLAPRAFHIVRTYIGTLDQLSWREIEELFAGLTLDATKALREAGVAKDEMRFSRSADMRYRGQRKEITVDLPIKPLTGKSGQILRAAFEGAYERIYQRVHAGHPVEALAWRLAASGPPIWKLNKNTEGNRKRRAAANPSGKRPLLFPGWNSHRLSPAYSRYQLAPGTTIRGPAVIEETESTVVVGPNGTAHVDDYQNLIIQLPQKGAA